MLEQIVRLFQWAPSGLRQACPEEQRIGEIAHPEEDAELERDVRQRDGRDLSNHGLEGKGGHDRDTDALGERARAEDFGWDDPRERAAGGVEAEVVGPRDIDEGSVGADFVADARREGGQEDRRDDEAHLVAEVTQDQRATASMSMIQQKLGDQRHDGIDRLVFES